jgi:hypothetical protein
MLECYIFYIVLKLMENQTADFGYEESVMIMDGQQQHK